MEVSHEEQAQRRSAIRAATKTLLAESDADARCGWGEHISRGVLAALADREPTTVFTYLNMPNEAPTRDVVVSLLADEGVRVVVPRVVAGSTDMTLHELRDLERDVRLGLWDIPTPRKRCPVVSGAEVDVVLTPMVAFDESGWRIGHGGGYYDRFLSAHPSAYRLGVAFELQRVDDCIPQEWDEPLHALVTENGIRRFRDAPQP
jgi:5-formyltetrahydrofolate cyclo-ligase